MKPRRGADDDLDSLIRTRRRALDERRRQLTELQRLDQELRAQMARVDVYLDPASRDSRLPAGAGERRRTLAASLDEVAARQRELSSEIEAVRAELEHYVERAKARPQRKRSRAMRRNVD